MSRFLSKHSLTLEVDDADYRLDNMDEGCKGLSV